MAFLIDELNSKQKNALSALKNTDNVDDATTMFCRKFEVSSVCYPDGTPTDRIKKSKEVLEKWRQQH
jgi:meiotically up-regulated gene 157 (Mug157) protein